MPIDDINAKLRSQQEVIKGKVVDKQGVHLNSDDLEAKLLRVGSGKSAETSDEDVDLANAEEIGGHKIDENGVHMSKDEVFSSLLGKLGKTAQIPVPKKGKSEQKTANNNVDLGIYQPVFEELTKIPFSDNYAEEMQVIAQAVKTAAMQFKVRKIIANTKSVAKNAQKFFYGQDNVRFVFSVLGKKYSMAAAGDFYGNEALHVAVDGDSLVGIVLRMQVDGDFSDVTSEFKIKIDKV